MSPDGQRLAYTRRGPRGETLLWVHAFDSAEDRPLAHTEEAAFPFWSPDSRNVGFFAQGKLKRIDAAGGSPLTLGDAPEGHGGTWSPEGKIVFAPGTVGPLVRVSAAGGGSRQVTGLDNSRPSIAQRWPHFLPDGRHFLHWRPQKEGGVFVGTTGSPEVRALIPGGSAAVFSNGQLLNVRGTILYAQPFDPVRLQLTGDARAIAEGVGWSADRGPAFSVSINGVLVFRTADDPKTRLVWFDRQGKMVGQEGEPGLVDVFSISPDGLRAVVSRRESEDGPPALWVMDFARSVNMRLTFGPINDPSPVWSPDGSRILYSSSRDADTGLFQLPANGSGKEELLLQAPGAIQLDSWSADGRFIAYTSLDTKGSSTIWVLPAGGDRKPMPILQDNFRARQASFSPDAHWVAYLSNESGRDEVYIRGFPAREGKWLISSSGGTHPYWRRDGRELFYMSSEGMLMAAEIETSASSIRPGVSRALFQTIGSTIYAASADGNRFLMNVPVKEESPSGINVILNWPQLLRK